MALRERHVPEEGLALCHALLTPLPLTTLALNTLPLNILAFARCCSLCDKRHRIRHEGGGQVGVVDGLLHQRRVVVQEAHLVAGMVRCRIHAWLGRVSPALVARPVVGERQDVADGFEATVIGERPAVRRGGPVDTKVPLPGHARAVTKGREHLCDGAVVVREVVALTRGEHRVRHAHARGHAACHEAHAAWRADGLGRVPV